MSELTSDRVVEAVSDIPWRSEEVLRVFWLCVHGPRDALATSLSRSLGGEEILGLVVRDPWFTNSNEVLSDVQRLFEKSKPLLQEITSRRPNRLTIIILLKKDLTFPQISSPIQLPNWFPVRPGLETYFYLTDLIGVNEGALLNSPELMIDKIAAQVYALEDVLVQLLGQKILHHRTSVTEFLKHLTKRSSIDVGIHLAAYRAHLTAVADPRAYRPNAAGGTSSIVTDFLTRVLDCSPPKLAENADGLGAQIELGGGRLKPSYLGVGLRPKRKMSESGANWHSIMLGLYQAYQTMNAAAHAGDYGRYPIGLLYYSSLDLQSFLQCAIDRVSLSLSPHSP